MRKPEPVTAECPPLAKPRVMRNQWLNVSFLHWAVEPSSVAHLCRGRIRPDVFEGRAYVGLVAFEMTNVGLPHGPSLLGRFLETNVRLYSVDETGRRGVLFLGLDTNRLAMVVGGRALVGVPYRWATMTYRRDARRHIYTSILRWPKVTAAGRLEVHVGDELTGGPLEHFVTARWGLHVARLGRAWYFPNAHPVWPLRSAELVSYHDDGLLASVGLGELSTRTPDHVAFSDGVPAWFGLPVPATRPRVTR